mmetsp:Transcript_30281/g.41051  ORF Transcript_30281/g.41051 Transcript_30281/m.41051 type:complete len:82 (+) Transcript_30281:24-269(+)
MRVLQRKRTLTRNTQQRTMIGGNSNLVPRGEKEDWDQSRQGDETLVLEEDLCPQYPKTNLLKINQHPARLYPNLIHLHLHY